MGKQTRRNKRNSSSNNKGGGKSSAKGSTESQQGGPVLLQRLRHADPRTRHAALAALLSTRLNSEELEQSTKPIDTALLQAIRERIMDADLECAQAAAGCLANYVTFGMQTDMDVTAGWLMVLVTRLQDCRDRLLDAPEKQKKQWWALTGQCLITLTGLVETNEQALQRLSPSHAFMTLDSVAIISNLLEIAKAALEPFNATATLDDQLESLVQDVCIYATRTLHSALDDNLDLYQHWSVGWDLLSSVVQCGTLPMAARLHAAGCLVAASQVSGGQLQSTVVTIVVPLLYQCLEFHPEISRALLEKYLDSVEKFNEEEKDLNVEKEVIRMVNERKEPARLIARRQKEMKDKKKQQLKEDGGDDDDDMKDDETNNQILRDHENRREVMEQARIAWHNSLLPLQLALEITANLTSLVPSQQMMEDDDDMADEAEWGPDQEAQLMGAQSQQAKDLSESDVALMQSIVASGLPSRLVQLLRVSCTPLLSKELPVDTKQEIEDVQSKCGVCLGHCLAEHFCWWGALWKDLRDAFEATGGVAVAGTMVVALRCRSEIRKQVQPDDLDFILKLVEGSNTVQREMVEMVGILCSQETHPEQVNIKVCSTLMQLPIKSATIVNEVLNALMDIYGEDDCHPQVFRSMQVLVYFQKTIPQFKKLIELERSNVSREEIELWRESALNGSRFVNYKKGQL